jgi:uncharacterized membrane protein YoaK (UPF0700 family)
LARSPVTGTHRTAPILLLLALAAGSLDAISYLRVGVFPANMTGNTVLLAVAVAREHGERAAHSATALGGFGLGVAVGVGLMPRLGGAWPRSAMPALLLETAILALLAVESIAGVAGLRYEEIALAAVAMGAQSSAVRSSHVSGVTTTYMTGTYMNAIARAVNRLRGVPPTREAPPGLPGAAWVTYAIGALAAGVAEKAWHADSILIPLVIVAVITAAATRSPKRED